MIAEAIDKLLALRQGTIITDQIGRHFKVGEAELLPSPDPSPPVFGVSTLSGLASYLAESIDEGAEAATVSAVHVVSPTLVRAVGDIHGDFAQRFTVAEAVPFLPDHKFQLGRALSLEDFIIGMQSHFIQDDATKQILEIVGNIVDEEEVVTEDDGMSQTVVARAGIAGRQSISVPNPVTLRPFRTFPEIEQPSSQYIVRVNKGPTGPVAALHPAGDAQWKVTAVERIVGWLEGEIDTKTYPVIG